MKHSWLAVLILALVVRSAVFATILPDPQRVLLASDSTQYLQRAQSIALEGRFGVISKGRFTLDVLRTPGYPALIALLILLTGEIAPLRTIAAAQVLIGGFLTLGVMSLAERLAHRANMPEAPIALIAGALYAFAPISVIMTGYAYAEILFTVWMVIAALLMLIGIERESFWIIGASGIAYGLATLTRPIGLPLVPLLILIPLIAPFDQSTNPQTDDIRDDKVHYPYIHWGDAGVALAGFLVILIPWLTRNALLFDRFSLSSITDINLYYYNAASLESHRQGISLDEARIQLADQLSREPKPDTRWPHAAEGALARKVILAHPFAFAFYNGIDALNGLRPGFSFMRSLGGVDSNATDSIDTFMHSDLASVLREIQSQSPLVILLEALFLTYILVVAIFSLVGLIVLALRRQWVALILLVAIPALLLYLPGIASNARFRAPVEPFLTILAAMGIEFIWRLVQQWRDRARFAPQSA